MDFTEVTNLVLEATLVAYPASYMPGGKPDMEKIARLVRDIRMDYQEAVGKLHEEFPPEASSITITEENGERVVAVAPVGGAFVRPQGA